MQRFGFVYFDEGILALEGKEVTKEGKGCVCDKVSRDEVKLDGVGL